MKKSKLLGGILLFDLLVLGVFTINLFFIPCDECSYFLVNKSGLCTTELTFNCREISDHTSTTSS